MATIIIKRCWFALALFSSVLLVQLAQAQRLDFFTLNPSEEEAFPAPGSPPATLWFGLAVAIDGNTALVSMPEASPPRVAVFTRNAAGLWLRTATLQNEVGSFLAISDDYALVASGDVLAAYRRTTQGWVRTQAINVGPSLSGLVMDGRVAAFVTSPPQQPASVQVLYRDPQGRWFSGPTLTNSDGGAWGSSFALSKHTLVVGAASQNDGRGAAYIFQRFGWKWREVQKLLAPEDEMQRFGAAVSVSGRRIAIGAPGTLPINENTGQATGAAYVFDRKGRFWYESQRLQSIGTDTNSLGSFLALTPSMLTVVAPAPDRFSFAEVFVYEPRGPHRTFETKGAIVLGDYAGIGDHAASGNTALTGVPNDSPFNTGYVAGYENSPTP
ncbi:MAG: FG-GAP repeat protein [Steroidobacteraceae bacterium]